MAGGGGKKHRKNPRKKKQIEKKKTASVRTVWNRGRGFSIATPRVPSPLSSPLVSVSVRTTVKCTRENRPFADLRGIFLLLSLNRPVIKKKKKKTYNIAENPKRHDNKIR